MKKITFLLFLFTCAINAQIGFSKSEIIKTNGESIWCYTAHISKTKPVSQVFYKTTRKGDVLKLNASEVHEVILRDKKHILIAKVDIDNRSNEMSKLLFLDRDRQFHFQNKILPLELMVDGSVPLYKSNLDGVEKFFIKDHNGEVKQLLYKRYFIMRAPAKQGNEYVRENNYYFSQLLSEAPCFTRRMKFKPPAFDELKLIAYFEKFNTGDCGKKKG